MNVDDSCRAFAEPERRLHGRIRVDADECIERFRRSGPLGFIRRLVHHTPDAVVRRFDLGGVESELVI